MDGKEKGVPPPKKKVLTNLCKGIAEYLGILQNPHYNLREISSFTRVEPLLLLPTTTNLSKAGPASRSRLESPPPQSAPPHDDDAASKDIYSKVSPGEFNKHYFPVSMPKIQGGRGQGRQKAGSPPSRPMGLWSLFLWQRCSQPACLTRQLP